MKHKILSIILIIVPALVLAGGDSHGEIPHLDGSIENLNAIWVIPFIGILFCPITIIVLWSLWSGPVVEPESVLIEEIKL